MTLVVDAKQIRVTSKQKCHEVMENECYSVCMVTVELLQLWYCNNSCPSSGLLQALHTHITLIDGYDVAAAFGLPQQLWACICRSTCNFTCRSYSLQQHYSDHVATNTIVSMHMR